ncbi:unnamed protein product [Calicophoron daubneyi]|uniref:PH domain-containing protein n=1 Tax=Calicophoron daubneyi TaxID=300641 RepID=A0AAV2TTR9_CALDB
MSSTPGVEIAKAGWVKRLSSILSIWKPAWLVIYKNGTLRSFRNPDEYIAKETIRLPTECSAVIETPSVSPPHGKSKECLFGFVFEDSRRYFCAESPDDALSWRLTINEARSLCPTLTQVHIPPAATHRGYTDGENYYQYTAYPNTTVPVYDAAHPSNPPVSYPVVYRGEDGRLIVPQQIIEHPDGSRTVVLGPGNEIMCRCRDGYYCGCHCDYADGALLGLAAGSLLWTPFMFPLFWW